MHPGITSPKDVPRHGSQARGRRSTLCPTGTVSAVRVVRVVSAVGPVGPVGPVGQDPPYGVGCHIGWVLTHRVLRSLALSKS
jgi:hypothetical protein